MVTSPTMVANTERTTARAGVVRRLPASRSRAWLRLTYSASL